MSVVEALAAATPQPSYPGRWPPRQRLYNLLPVNQYHRSNMQATGNTALAVRTRHATLPWGRAQSSVLAWHAQPPPATIPVSLSRISSPGWQGRNSRPQADAMMAVAPFARLTP